MTPTPPSPRRTRSCERPIVSIAMNQVRLAEIDVRVFEHLHDAEEIDVRVVTPAAQLAMALHPDSTVVELSP